MAAIDPGEAGAIKSQDHSRASLQVIRRFCLTVSFFAVWAMARQQLDPMLHFGAMLRAASWCARSWQCSAEHALRINN